MSVLITFEPEVTASGGARVHWRVTQQNGSGNPIGTSGKREDVLKTFQATVRARLKEGITVEAKVYTAAGQLEEHATYTPDGKAARHAVPPVTGESGFGRRCTVLTGTKETRAEYRKKTTPAAPPKAAKAPKEAKPPKAPKAAKAPTLRSSAPVAAARGKGANIIGQPAPAERYPEAPYGTGLAVVDPAATAAVVKWAAAWVGAHFAAERLRGDLTGSDRMFREMTAPPVVTVEAGQPPGRSFVVYSVTLTSPYWPARLVEKMSNEALDKFPAVVSGQSPAGVPARYPMVRVRWRSEDEAPAAPRVVAPPEYRTEDRTASPPPAASARPPVEGANLRLFGSVYAEELLASMKASPDKYAYEQAEAPAAAARMTQAVAAGTFNKDGRAMAQTCKRLGIPYTYAGIAEWLQAPAKHRPPAPASAAPAKPPKSKPFRTTIRTPAATSAAPPAGPEAQLGLFMNSWLASKAAAAPSG